MSENKKPKNESKDFSKVQAAVSYITEIAFSNASGDPNSFLDKYGNPIISSLNGGQSFRDIHGHLSIQEIISKLKNPINEENQNPSRDLDFFTVLMSVHDNKDAILKNLMNNDAFKEKHGLDASENKLVESFFIKNIGEAIAKRINSGEFIESLGVDKSHPAIQHAVSKNEKSYSQELTLKEMSEKMKDLVRFDRDGSSIELSLPISELISVQMGDLGSSKKSITELAAQENIKKSINSNPIQAALEVRFSNFVLSQEIEKREALIEEQRSKGVSAKELKGLDEELMSFYKIRTVLDRIKSGVDKKIEDKVSDSPRRDFEVVNILFDKYGADFIKSRGDRYDLEDKDKLIKNQQFISHFSKYLSVEHEEEFNAAREDVEVDMVLKIEKMVEEQKKKLEKHTKNPFGIRDKDETNLIIDYESPFHKIFNPDEDDEAVKNSLIFKNITHNKKFKVFPSGRSFCDERGNVMVEQHKKTCYLKNSVKNPEERVKAITDSTKIILSQSKNNRELIKLNFSKIEKPEVRMQMAESSFEAMFEHLSNKSGIKDSTKLTSKMEEEFYAKMQKRFMAQGIKTSELIEKHKQKMAERRSAKLETNVNSHIEDQELVDKTIDTIEGVMSKGVVSDDSFGALRDFISDSEDGYNLNEDGCLKNQVICRVRDLSRHIDEQIETEKESLRRSDSPKEEMVAKKEIKSLKDKSIIVDQFEKALGKSIRAMIIEKNTGALKLDPETYVLDEDDLRAVVKNTSSEIAERLKQEAEKKKSQNRNKVKKNSPSRP